MNGFNGNRNELLQHRIWWLIIIGVIVGSVFLRLTFLGDVPHAAYVDEAATGANVLCVADSGTSAFGEKWPLFSEVMLGNWEPPTIVYPAALWSLVAGKSIAALRLFVAVAVLATILGVFLIARELADLRTATFAALLATLAPWSFQAGRVFWKCPLAPLFVVWGVYFFFRGLRRKSGATTAVSAGFFSLALYSYQSAWAQVPLICLVLLVFTLRDRDFAMKSVPVFSLTGLALCTPLIVLAINGGLMKRAGDVSVFGAGIPVGTLRFVRNYLLHFDPMFLFWHGDGNLRHGVGSFGQLSWLDAFAWIVGLATLFLMRKSIWPNRTLAIIAVVGVLAGVMPAALSNEGIPHALRANGVWPFAALLGAWLLSLQKREHLVNAGVALVGLIFFLCSMTSYFSTYAVRSARFFPETPEHTARIAAASGTWGDVLAVASPIHARFYMMSLGGLSCPESAEIANASMSGAERGRAQKREKVENDFLK